MNQGIRLLFPDGSIVDLTTPAVPRIGEFFRKGHTTSLFVVKWVVYEYGMPILIYLRHPKEDEGPADG